MADTGAPAEGGSRTRTAWILGAVAVAVLVIVAVLFVRGIPSSSSGASPAGLPSPTSTATPNGPADVPTTPSPRASAETSDPTPVPELAPVAPQQPATAAGIQVALTSFESVTGEVVVPGEVQAAAVRVTVQITNTGQAPLDLNLVVVSAYMGEQRDPAETYQQPGGMPVSGSLDPGATASGVYLFRIPDDRRSDVTFVVDYRGDEPALTWRGAVPQS